MLKYPFKKIPGSNKSEKPIDVTGIDKIHLKCDCIKGGFVNGEREPILFGLELNKPRGQKIPQKTKNKTF